jgi:hypothetical protein
MQTIEAREKKQITIKKQEVVAKRTAEVWQQSQADDGNAAIVNGNAATAMAKVMAAAAAAAIGSQGKDGGQWLR